MTTNTTAATIDDMKAVLLYRHREDFEDGGILEVVVWRVPVPVPGCDHPFKYRLFYGYPGHRVIAYDNERGKGDHRHRNGAEQPYRFTSPERLVDDFLAEVDQVRSPK